MWLTMHTIALVLGSLVCVGHALRMQTATQRLRSSPGVEKQESLSAVREQLSRYQTFRLSPLPHRSQSSSGVTYLEGGQGHDMSPFDQLKRLSRLLLGFNPAAAFNPSIAAMHSAVRGPASIGLHPRVSDSYNHYSFFFPLMSTGVETMASGTSRAYVEMIATAEPTQQAEGDTWLMRAASSSPAATSLLEPVRAAAMSALESLRFPRSRDEAWRGFELSLLSKARIVAPAEVDVDMLKEMLEECSNTSVSAGMRIVLVDGVYNAELSDTSALPADVYFGSLSNAGEEVLKGTLEILQRDLPEAHANPNTALGCYTFAALNHASLADVVSVWVPEGVHVEHPLHLVMLSTSAQSESSAEGAVKGDVRDTLSVSCPNLVVSIGDNANLSLLQNYGGRSGGYFVNALSRFELGQGASLEHSYVQEQANDAIHIDSVLVEAGADSEFKSQMLQSGGRAARVNVQVRLSGRGARSSLEGLVLATDRQLSDLHSMQVHVAPSCFSKQEHRQALGGACRVIFKGGVRVPFGSDQTETDQIIRTLLLSDKARADVAPTMEIDTDDVMCKHGATISDLDDEMILYLQARGVSRKDARALLLKGWAISALDRVPDPGVKMRAAEKAASLTFKSAQPALRGQYSSI